MKTYGFDYAFALSVDAVNATLKRNLAGTDLRVEYDTTDADSGTTIKLVGKLAPWRIVRGGSNTLLNVMVTFAEGSLTLSGAIARGYDLAGVAVELQISLGWLGEGTALRSTGGAAASQLVFHPTSRQDKTAPGYVSTIDVFDDAKRLDTLAKGLLRLYMPEVMIANRERLRTLLASVDPASAKVDSWLKPSKWLYFYTETKTNAALCFLGMLSADAPFPQPAFDSDTLASSTNAIILIAQSRFYGNVLLPALRKSLAGATFNADCPNDACTIRNAGPFDVGKITTREFTLATSGNGLSIQASGGGPLKFLFGLAKLPNASYAWSLRTRNPLQYGNGQITFAVDPRPEIQETQDIKWYDWVLLVVTGIVSLPTLIALIVDAVNHFSDQVQLVGFPQINAQLTAAVQGTVVNLASLVQWSKEGERFSVTDAGLEGALYVRGSLT